ncbi:protein-L-isoaspartate O-methyltransferase [Embleya sp. NPDC059237]|uniref:protein-L-isoaspartate O-methyltransferase family protein n=1 Tax=Embleya sp. NPDC059237 TaxID=3346784 RepID=UPI0036A70086
MCRSRPSCGLPQRACGTGRTGPVTRPRTLLSHGALTALFHHRLVTGTGYIAALPAARGYDVVSVEIDPELAEQARANLARAGFGDAVRVVTGDGTLGHPGPGSYDRVQVTAGVRHIPAAWIKQARPAVIVMPWGTDFTAGDCAVCLDVDEGGAVRAGRSRWPPRS